MKLPQHAELSLKAGSVCRARRLAQGPTCSGSNDEEGLRQNLSLPDLPSVLEDCLQRCVHIHLQQARSGTDRRLRQNCQTTSLWQGLIKTADPVDLPEEPTNDGQTILSVQLDSESFVQLAALKVQVDFDRK